MRDWIIPALVAIALVATCTRARADPPRLPVGITCPDVRAKVAEHGKVYAYAWAMANGYSPKEISQIRKICGV